MVVEILKNTLRDEEAIEGGLSKGFPMQGA